MTYVLLQFLGFVYLTAGAAMSLKPDSFKAGVDSFLKSSGMTFFAGMIAMIMGAALISLHSSWGNVYEIIVSVVGWAALLKGFLYLAFPKDLKAMAGKLYKSQTCIRVWGMVVLVAGAVFMGMANGLI